MLSTREVCVNEGCTNLESRGTNKECDTCVCLKRKGINTPQRDSMFRSLGGVCPLCLDKMEIPSQTKKGGSTRKQAVVDHIHGTKLFRGLICSNCNRAIGYIEDNPDTAKRIASYLIKTLEKQND
jgi:hypothetical protein